MFINFNCELDFVLDVILYIIFCIIECCSKVIDGVVFNTFLFCV